MKLPETATGIAWVRAYAWGHRCFLSDAMKAYWKREKAKKEPPYEAKAETEFRP